MLKNRLAAMFLPAAAVGVASAFSPALADFTIDYGGYKYSLAATGDSWYSEFQKVSWYGDKALAKELSYAVGLGLGSTQSSLDGVTYVQKAPLFAYKIEEYNLTFERRSFCQYIKEGSADGSGQARSACSEIPFLNIGGSAYGYVAYETAPRVPISASLAIQMAGNAVGGSGLNVTSNLGTSLLPQFQGGTLTVSPSATNVSSDFTLDGSVTNAIDAAGNNATFSGVFSDQSGATGAITFTNSSSSPAALTLSGTSTYTGQTGITGTANLLIGKENALPQRTLVSVSDLASLKLQTFNQAIGALSGSGSVDLGSGTLTLQGTASGGDATSTAAMSGSGSLVKAGGFTQILNGALSFTGPTSVQAGTLELNGTSASAVSVDPGATLTGSGIISGDITNSGRVSPGGAAGSALTIENGTYTQSLTGVLDLNVNGTDSTLLQLIGSSSVSELSGTVKISGSPTPGVVYTGISGPTAYQGNSTANADTSQVVIAAAYKFCREDDPCFKYLNGSPSVDATKLQFGWASLDTTGAIVPVKDVSPQEAITRAKTKGGPITKVITDPVPAPAPGPTPDPKPGGQTLMGTCVANTNDPSGCNTALQPGQTTQPVSPNLVTVAKGLDGGNAAVASVVNSGVGGGSSIPSATGTPTGYTTNQAKAAGLPSDFVTVLSAVNSLPTRSALISSLHQVTAEPYASMQSVALEAMEQFRFNALALSRGDKAIRLFTDAEVCRLDDGTLIPASSEERPTDCKPRKISQASRWSLLIDATNTQASLNGTNDLASLDYNIFQSTYGLQYDASRQWSVGAAFGYGQANLYNYEYANSSISSDTYGGGLWGIYRPGDAWKITGLVGYMNLQYDSSRNINFGGINRNAWANWSGNGFTTALDVQYDWVLSGNKADRNAIRIKPNTYLSYSLHNQGDITESGADSLNLAINGHTADSLIYGIGFTVETPVQLARSTRLIPRLSVGYEYDFNGDSNEEHQLTASFADVPALGSLDVLGQNRGANDLNVGLSVELETSDQFSLYAGVGGSFWSNGNEINYGGGLRWRFGGAPKATIAKAEAVSPATPLTPAQATPAQQPTIRGLW